MTPITDEALAEIKAGLAGGIEGEWRVSRHRASSRAIQTKSTDTEIATVPLRKFVDNRAAEALSDHIARMSKPTVASMIARIEAAEARVKRLEEALGDCAEWFKGYGDSHTAKGDIDKAQRNYDRERRARAALEGE